ncbi:unnamed protein product [Acanthoscelides obtectus]|uniref:Uncharacterized protein n=1 Tax=Acanthoscelides obtectus TaxID=200917 RepID=A0A9P0JHU3_ACAOB|nr:unnamed protein product [Acanthoscelides obtectus]CAK1661576.1 hypothetical protein AOBTE_LOCUS22693 [Acanthoscelides obtectus]
MPLPAFGITIMFSNDCFTSAIMIIYVQALMYPVVATIVFYPPLPLFTSRPLRPDELAQMLPHTTPKTWTMPYVPFPTTKMVPKHQEDFSRGILPNTPPLYTSRPLRSEELAQMVSYTTPKTWANLFDSFAGTYQEQIRRKFTGGLFHTSPPLYTSRPLRREELIQMVEHKKTDTWSTPFEGLRTTTKAVGRFEKSSTEYPREIFDQPDGATDELYSPTFWSFGTFMANNNTSAIPHPTKQEYSFQSATNYENQHKLTESETYFGGDHTLETISAIQKYPNTIPQEGYTDNLVPSQFNDAFGKYYTSGSKVTIPEAPISQSEREVMNHPTTTDSTSHIEKDYLLGKHQLLPDPSATKHVGRIVSQFSTVKPFIKAIFTNPTTISPATTFGLPISNGSSSKYEHKRPNISTEFDIFKSEDHTSRTTITVGASLISHFATSQHETSEKDQESKTDIPKPITSSSKYYDEFSEQLTPIKHATNAEIGDTFEIKLVTSESSTSKSHEAFANQPTPHSETFVHNHYSAKGPISESFTSAYPTKLVEHIPQKYSTPKLQKEFVDQAINQKDNTSLENENRHSTEMPVGSSEIKLPYTKSFTFMAQEATTEILQSKAPNYSNKAEVTNQFHPTEPANNNEAHLSMNRPASKFYTIRPQIEYNSPKYTNLTGKGYTTTVSPFLLKITTHRLVMKLPSSNITTFSPQMGSISHAERKSYKNGTKVFPNQEATEHMTSKHFSQDTSDIPTDFFTNHSETTTILYEYAQSTNQTTTQNNILIKKLGNITGSFWGKPTLESSADYSHSSEFEEEEIKTTNQTAPHSSYTDEQQSPSVYQVQQTGNLKEQVENTNPGLFKENVQPSKSGQIKNRKNGNFLYKFDNLQFAHVQTTTRPASSTSNPEFSNDLYYSDTETGNEGSKQQQQQHIQYSSYNMPETFDNPFVYPQPISTEVPEVQVTQPESAVSKQAEYRVVPVPKIGLTFQESNSDYGVYNTASTTAAPNYESSSSRIGNFRWYAVPGISYTNQQNSNSGIPLLVQQNTYNSESDSSSEYSWKLSGLNDKPNNFNTNEGNLEVSSTKNELKFIYRHNMHDDLASKRGSSHIETLHNPDGGKTHKLVFYV